MKKEFDVLGFVVAQDKEGNPYARKHIEKMVGEHLEEVGKNQEAYNEEVIRAGYDNAEDYEADVMNGLVSRIMTIGVIVLGVIIWAVK